MIEVALDGTFSDWRKKARSLVDLRRQPRDIVFGSFSDAQSSLGLETPFSEGGMEQPKFSVPRNFLEIAERVSHHRHSEKWSLLYRVLYRLVYEEPHLLEISSDPDIVALSKMQKNLSRDMHKMKAFVRFQQISEAENQFVAWYEPDHFIVPLVAPFFQRRFAAMNWSIFTPDCSAHWQAGHLSYSAGVEKIVQAGDELETLWNTYYASIFNPARTSLRTMKKEMPVRFWKNLPETAQIGTLIHKQSERVTTMLKKSSRSAAEFIPADVHSIEELATAAQACEGCPLFKNATQAVFGAGSSHAPIMFVGEQPGDKEDRKGTPFVGPAGKLLRERLAEAGIRENSLYITNAVKHFSWRPSGKIRLHKKPLDSEIAACQPWLINEVALIQPKIIVCLGATAARSVFGKLMKIESERGKWQRSAFSDRTIITYHPSALLRAVDETTHPTLLANFMQDLLSVAQQFQHLSQTEAETRVANP